MFKVLIKKFIVLIEKLISKLLLIEKLISKLLKMCKKTGPLWQFDFGAGFIYHFTAFRRLSGAYGDDILRCIALWQVEVESLSIPRVTYER